MRYNENQECEISWSQFNAHIEEIGPKVEAITFTIESINQLREIAELFEGKKIDSWQIGVGEKTKNGHKQTMVVDFKLRPNQHDQVFEWLETKRPSIGWGLWEKFGDPLIYTKGLDNKLFRFYWLGQRIGHLKAAGAKNKRK